MEIRRGHRRDGAAFRHGQGLKALACFQGVDLAAPFEEAKDCLIEAVREVRHCRILRQNTVVIYLIVDERFAKLLYYWK